MTEAIIAVLMLATGAVSACATHALRERGLRRPRPEV